MTTSLEHSARDAMRRWLAVPGNSQAKLAEKLGWKQPTVHEIVREQAPRRIKLDEVPEIAAAIGQSVASLLGLDDSSDLPTGEIQARVDELRQAIDETSAQVNAANEQAAAYQERADHFANLAKNLSDRVQGYYGRWAEASAELDRRK